MLTGELRSQVDRIWDAFWSGGISNPLEVIEQITYLLRPGACRQLSGRRVSTRGREGWTGRRTRRSSCGTSVIRGMRVPRLLSFGRSSLPTRTVAFRYSWPS